MVSCNSDDNQIPDNPTPEIRFEFTPAMPLITGLASDIFLETDGEIKNLSDGTLTLAWKRTQANLPMNWQTQVCDPNACYLPLVDNHSFSLSTDSTGIMRVRFLPDSISGTGTTTIAIWELGDSANTAITVNYKGIAS